MVHLLLHAAILAFYAVNVVHAWGVLGHATIAYIAQSYVSSSTKSWAQGILDDQSTSYLASIASWADDYRETKAGKWSAPMHFLDANDNPPTTCDVNYERDCGELCSVLAIQNYTQRVVDTQLSSSEITEALKFLVHITGDLTQPLHNEAYEVGGNDIEVKFDGYSDNLHADWDTYIAEKLVGSSTLAHAKSWAATLVTEINSGSYKSEAASWIDGDSISDSLATALRWSSDSNAKVCTVVMPDGAAVLEAESDLYPTYYDSVIDTVELQIAKGGYRLGNWLNLVYKSEIAKRGQNELLTDGEDLEPILEDRDVLPELSRAQLTRAVIGESMRHTH